MAKKSNNDGSETVSEPSARELLAVNMVKLRNKREWSQESLALESNLHRSFIGHVEARRRNISLDNVERIARALGVAVRDLFAPINATERL